MRDDNCKIELKLDEIHDWAHACLKSLEPQELRRAHEIGHKILDMLNEIQESNPVKFLAMFEVLSIGADMLELTTYREGSTVTIN